MPRKPKDTTTAKPPKTPARHKRVDLDDLNHDPSLLDSLSKTDIARLHNEAEKGEIPLSGNVRAQLNTLYNVTRDKE